MHSHILGNSAKAISHFFFMWHKMPLIGLCRHCLRILKCKDTYKEGWDAIREARYARMFKLGLIDPATTKLSPRLNKGLRWEDNPDKEWGARAMAVHAAMIDRMDKGVGRIIAALKETGALDNTLIVFLSDNGASPEDCARYGKGFDRPG